MNERDARDLGRAMAEAAAGIARDAQSSWTSRVNGRVSAVNGDGTINVNVGSDEVPMTVSSVPRASACRSAQVGDTVTVDLSRHVPLATDVTAYGTGHALPIFSWSSTWSGTPSGLNLTEREAEAYVPGPLLCEVYAAVGGTGEYGMALEFFQGEERKGAFSATSPTKNGGTLRWTESGVVTLAPGTYRVRASTHWWGSVNIVAGDSSGNSMMPRDAMWPAGVSRYMRAWAL